MSPRKNENLTTNFVSSSTVGNDNGTTATIPDGGDGGYERKTRWWKMLVTVDKEESRNQILFALPMILTNVFYSLMALVPIMFAGHLGELELAGSTLAYSWAMVSGFGFMVGLSGALETLCGQAFGSHIYNKMGIYLQASCIISLFFSIPIVIMWWYTKPIFILLHQSYDISDKATLYLKFLIPGLFAHGCLQNIMRFLQAQSVVFPLIVCSTVPLAFQIGITYMLIHLTSLGYKGAPLAASIAYWISFLMLAAYVAYSKRFAHTWNGFSMESFQHIATNSRFALPSAVVYCLELWAFELLVLLAGLLPDAETTTPLISLCVNTEEIVYRIIYGLSAATSTRVSNELGAGNPNRAKHAMGVALKLSFILGILFYLALGFGSSLWASSFSGNEKVIQAFSSISPLLLISISIDSIQGVLSGVSRGCGWQNLAMYINLITFYLVGMPVACLLAFRFNFNAKGLWIGLICGLFFQTVALFLMTRYKQWIGVKLYVNQ